MRAAVLTAVFLTLLPVSGAAAAGVHAHRGGPLSNGAPAQPENSLEAFRNAQRLGADVIELDAKVTRDGVPVVMHDVTLDRTTNCSGRVADLSAAEVAGCRIDILGTDGNSVPLARSKVRVPTLAEVLRWAKKSGASLNLEIKNVPNDDDFDPTPAFAQAVLDELARSGIPHEQVLVQSFWPPNLDQAKAAGFRTSFLTLQQMNEGGVAFAAAQGYDVLSPQWPMLTPTYWQAAAAAGLPVVPWTLDDAASIATAVALGADAVITNDPPLALALTR